MHLYVATNDDTLEKWDEFRNAFKANRFLINQQFTIIEEHLQTIISEEKREIDVGSTFFRARINRQAGKPYTAEELNMAPADKVGHGRLNPEGIPYLYLASDWKTAISEVRANDSDVVDIEEIAKIAHAHKIPLVIDNTFGTPYLIRPIEYGADSITIHYE